MSLYSEKDFVEIVDENDRPLPSVPKSWVKAEMLPPGAKPKSGRRSSSSSSIDAAAKAKADAEAKAQSEADAKAEEEAKAKADADAKAAADAAAAKK